MRYVWIGLLALVSAACAAERPAVKAKPSVQNRCAAFDDCLADASDPDYGFLAWEDMTDAEIREHAGPHYADAVAELRAKSGDYINALSGPGLTVKTSWRPMVGKFINCPVLYLTETYAITVAHCADSNGVAPGDFTNNQASGTGATMKLRNQNGLHTRTNVSWDVVLHSSVTPGVNPSTADNDIAMYEIKTNKWDLSVSNDARARIFVSGVDYPGCLTNTYGNHGAATWAGTENARIDSSENHCSSSEPLESTSNTELRNYNSTELPKGSKIDYQNGDSGGATYLTTSTTRKPAITGLIQAGTTGDTDNEYAVGLLAKTTWIKAQDTVLGGPSISSWTQTLSVGSQNITVRYYTDSSE